jgi:hypothetical protein
MTLEYQPFYRAHTKDFKPKQIFEGERGWKERLVAAESNPNAKTLTLLRDKKPIAFVGLMTYWPGVAEVWSLTSEAVKECPLAFHKAVLGIIESHWESMGLHRMQMVVKAEDTDALRWANSLLFEPEAVLRHFGPDRADYVLFARIA